MALLHLVKKCMGENYKNTYFLVGTALLLVWNFAIYNMVIWKKK